MHNKKIVPRILVMAVVVILVTAGHPSTPVLLRLLPHPDLPERLSKRLRELESRQTRKIRLHRLPLSSQAGQENDSGVGDQRRG
jgi:hypothetical protein